MVSGEPIYYKQNQMYYEICCDCGLTHFVGYRVVKRKRKMVVEKVVYRDNHRTKQERGKMRVKITR
jgi:hypothetical protein